MNIVSLAMTKDKATADGPRKYLAVGDRLRRARIAAGFEKQTELAEAAGVGALTINRVEMGRAPLSKATAIKLAPVLRRSEAYLLFGVEGGPDDRPRPNVPPAVGQYLTDDPYGKDASPQVAKLLRELDYSSIGLANPSVKDVHRAREMIEVNLAIARQRRT